MEPINAIRPKPWGRRQRDAGPIASVDVDDTLAPTSGKRKRRMSRSYNGVWGYAPLIVSLANSKEVLYVDQSGRGTWPVTRTSLGRGVAHAPDALELASGGDTLGNFDNIFRAVGET
jgi:hypothetical protein